MPTHVHIGTGRFGLGFVGYFSNKLGFSTTFLNRTAERSRSRNEKLRVNKKYHIKYYDADQEDAVGFDRLEFFSQEDVGHALALLRDSDTLLVTTTVGESQLPSVAPLIAQGLKERNTNAPLFLIACENGHRCSSVLARRVNAILETEQQNAVFVDCVVDQICHGINVNEEMVTVSAESYREWIIEETDSQLEQQLREPRIKFVQSDQLDLYELRKLWLVNGFHLALAILGATSSGGGTDTRIKEVLETTDAELEGYVEGIQRELVDALLYEKENRTFNAGDLQDYIEKTKNRFKASPDNCKRILRDALLDPDRIAQVTRDFGTDLGRNKPLSAVFRQHLYQCVFNFFEKVHDRLYEPTRKNSDRNASKILPYILVQLVPFLVQQGESLISSDLED